MLNLAWYLDGFDVREDGSKGGAKSNLLEKCVGIARGERGERHGGGKSSRAEGDGGQGLMESGSDGGGGGA